VAWQNLIVIGLALAAAVVDIVAHASGTVAVVAIEPGDRVDATLVVIELGDPAVVAKADAALARAKRAIEAHARVHAAPDLRELDAEIRAARVMFARQGQLRRLAEITNREWQVDVEAMLVMEAVDDELRARRRRVAEDPRARGIRLRAELDAARRRRARASSIVRAGRGGTIAEVLVAPGDRVQRGQVVVRIVVEP
jgi:multidrug efflux pump subunit AcrA (membrane-fusion protein)